MTPDFDNSDSIPMDDQDLGKPIEALRDLEQDISPSFFNRVRSKIWRRTAASQMASFSWHLPVLILVEFWNMLVEVLNPGATQKGGRS